MPASLQGILSFSELEPREYVFFPLHLIADEEHALVLRAIVKRLAADAQARFDMAHTVLKASILRYCCCGKPSPCTTSHGLCSA